MVFNIITMPRITQKAIGVLLICSIVIVMIVVKGEVDKCHMAENFPRFYVTFLRRT